MIKQPRYHAQVEKGEDEKKKKKRGKDQFLRDFVYRHQMNQMFVVLNNQPLSEWNEIIVLKIDKATIFDYIMM